MAPANRRLTFPQKIIAAIEEFHEGDTGTRLGDISDYIIFAYGLNLSADKFDQMLRGQVTRMVNKQQLAECGCLDDIWCCENMRYRLVRAPILRRSPRLSGSSTVTEASGELISTARKSTGSVKSTAESPKKKSSATDQGAGSKSSDLSSPLTRRRATAMLLDQIDNLPPGSDPAETSEKSQPRTITSSQLVLRL